MIFGIGGVVATKAADSLVERLKTLTGAVLTVEAVRVAGLKEGFQGAMGKRKSARHASSTHRRPNLVASPRGATPQ